LNCQKVIGNQEDDEETLKMPTLNSSDTSNLLMTLNTYTDFLNRIPLGPPLLGDTSSGYGFRRSVFRRGLSFHKGTDFTLENGRMVHATADGTVSKVKFDRTYGKVVDVDHGNGISTRYAHLARSLVSEGQKVARGERIAIAGNSGMSTGPHLHYEVQVNRRSRDPLKFVRLANDLNLILEN
ncbi:MAG: M23 family metallopeptidase, partial [SAR324 cluster bacterium]|nr:M23 family metallopeptidase [SAR324 cluster bacterium]